MEDLSIILDIVDKLTTVGLLLYVWMLERQRSSELSALIVQDWQRKSEQDFIENAQRRALPGKGDDN